MGLHDVTTRPTAKRGRPLHRRRSRVKAERGSFLAAVSLASAHVLETAGQHALPRAPSVAMWPACTPGDAPLGNKGYDSLPFNVPVGCAAHCLLVWRP